MAGGYATPNQLYRLNKLGLLVVGKGEPLKPDEADALIRASGWEPKPGSSPPGIRQGWKDGVGYGDHPVGGNGLVGTSDVLEP